LLKVPKTLPAWSSSSIRKGLDLPAERKLLPPPIFLGCFIGHNDDEIHVGGPRKGTARCTAEENQAHGRNHTTGVQLRDCIQVLLNTIRHPPPISSAQSLRLSGLRLLRRVRRFTDSYIRCNPLSGVHVSGQIVITCSSVEHSQERFSICALSPMHSSTLDRCQELSLEILRLVQITLRTERKRSSSTLNSPISKSRKKTL
jgi:hypothetical protein